MRFPKIKDMSIPGAMILSALIVGISIFLTTWIFFGGDNNRQRLSVKNPALNKPPQTNPVNVDQLKKLQEQRAAQLKNQTPPPPPTESTTTKTAE